jgi:hypothetical protein
MVGRDEKKWRMAPEVSWHSGCGIEKHKSTKEFVWLI